MAGMSVSELRKDVLELCSGGRYDEALELVRREAAGLAQETWRLTHWCFSLAAQAGERETALRILGDALDSGLWYAGEQLRADPSLHSLQGDPEFEALAARSEARCAVAQAEARPRLVTLQPQGRPPRGGYPLLMALHGNTASAAGSAPFWQPAVSNGWLVALPQSSQMVGNDAYVWDHHLLAVQEIEDHHRALREQHSLHPRRAVIGGFSMGGRLAVWMALQQTIPVRGFVAVAPWVPEIESWMPLVEGAKGSGLRGTIIVGENDAGCFTGARALGELLDSEGIACDLQVIPGLAHDYPADFAKRLQRALRAMG